MSEQDEKFMRRAIELAKKGIDHGAGGPFGAVVVKNGEIIAEGWNEVTSKNDPTAHAEVSAIRKACAALKDFQLRGCTIYTSCEPCPMCLGAIYWARPEKMFYACTREDAAGIGFDDQFIYDEIGRDLEERRIETINLLRIEGLGVFKMWESMPQKIEY
ncbi:MAG: nucleoside deaminase [Pyrinomonadaceae bacterium]|nr:nucleoside deaminase [Pyrinomonadaceae bacterium]